MDRQECMHEKIEQLWSVKLHKSPFIFFAATCNESNWPNTQRAHGFLKETRPSNAAMQEQKWYNLNEFDGGHSCVDYQALCKE